MIFDKNFDKTLKLLIDGDSKNRDRIINFVQTIPGDFLKQIQEKIAEYNECKLNNNSGLFCGDYYGKDGYLYSFCINKYENVLAISRHVCKYGLYFNDMDLVLASYDDNDSKRKKYIGSLISNYNYIVDEKSVHLGNGERLEYYLVNMLFNNYLLINDVNFLLPVDINIVNTDKLEEDYTINSIKDNKLIRSRKKS